MTEQSAYLVSLAQHVVRPYTALPTCRAAMVTGSAAKGLSDNYSDLDLTIYYADDLPDEEMLAAIRQQHGAGERKWLLGDRAEHSIAEAYDLHGIEVQIGHTTIAAWEASIAQVLEKLEVDSPLQKALEGTLACQALYGEAYIAAWQARLAAYPPAWPKPWSRSIWPSFPSGDWSHTSVPATPRFGIIRSWSKRPKTLSACWRASIGSISPPFNLSAWGVFSTKWRLPHRI
ncbi:MAG: hypothetical protein R3E79_12785 [Caldilineaceae bacterium]